MDDFDDLSYSFYADKGKGYIDSEDNIVNNCKNNKIPNKNLLGE